MRQDPVLLLLFIGVMVFTGVIIGAERFFPNDGQLFQVLSGLVTGFAGAFFARITPQGKPPQNQQTIAADQIDAINPKTTPHIPSSPDNSRTSS